jgi:hypothetical protein
MEGSGALLAAQPAVGLLSCQLNNSIRARLIAEKGDVSYFMAVFAVIFYRMETDLPKLPT